MNAGTRHFTNCLEATRADKKSRPELPRCDALRACAALTSIAQYALITNISTKVDLSQLVQCGFCISGFLVTCFLLRERRFVSKDDGDCNGGIVAWTRGMLKLLPVAQMMGVIAAVIFIPQFMALDSIEIPEAAELPTIILKLIFNYFADFQKQGFEGRTLLCWPIILLLVPRRFLSATLLSVLACSMVMQLAGLFSGDLRPATMVVSPSAVDLLSLGAFLAVILHRGNVGQCEAQIGLWSVVTGMALAVIIVGFQFQGRLPSWGAVTMLSAPIGFGILNFMMGVVATTLVSSLSWRDIGGMVDTVKRVPAH